MDKSDKERVCELWAAGCGYAKIAATLNLNANTVKSYCRRHGLTADRSNASEILKANVDATTFCLCCGTRLHQNEGRKPKKFCSDECRNKWWNTHLDQVNRKANYNLVCQNCGKSFISYGKKNRKYCSRNCYMVHRRSERNSRLDP